MTTYTDLVDILKEMKENWGEAGEEVVELAFRYHKKMEFDDFLKHCTAMGGNWGGMLLSGLKRLYKPVYDAVPDDMGPLAFAMITNTLLLCGVYVNED